MGLNIGQSYLSLKLTTYYAIIHNHIVSCHHFIDTSLGSKVGHIAPHSERMSTLIEKYLLSGVAKPFLLQKTPY